MTRILVLTTCAALTLSACSQVRESRLNPLNWFGRGEQVETTAAAPATPEVIRPLLPAKREVVVDARVLIDTVQAIEVARTPDGAILRATGLAPTQGYFNAQLVLSGAENGVLTYDFRVEAPSRFEIQGTQASRSITVAEALSNNDLAGVRRIVVRGANNSMQSSR